MIMGKPSIVIADLDVEYALKVEAKFLKEFRDEVKLEVITELAYCREFLSRPHDIDVMLVSDGLYTDDVRKQNVKNLYVLTDRDADGDLTSSAHAEYVFKYGSLNFIFNRVKGSSDALRAIEEGNRETSVVLFYSPIGGSGSTTAAVAVAGALQKNYHRVLFVDAQYIQSFESFLRRERESDTSMVRAVLGVSGPEVFDRLRSYIASDDFDYLPAVKSGLLAFDLTLQLFVDFIEGAKRSGQYDYVVVDTDASFGLEKLQLLNVADSVVVCVEQGPRALAKVLRFVSNVDGGCLAKCRFVCNKYRKDERNMFVEGGTSTGISLTDFIDYDRSLAEMGAAQLCCVEGFVRLARTIG